MINIAAVIDNLGPSQKSFYLIKEFNKVLSNKDVCVSVFFERAAIPVVPTMFSCKSVAFLSGYHDIAIATTLNEANTLLKANNNSTKYLYLWDMEWLTAPRQFSAVCDVLLDDRLQIIARSKSHSNLIYNFCNKIPVGIVDNWNINSIIELTQKEVAHV